MCGAWWRSMRLIWTCVCSSDIKDHSRPEPSFKHGCLKHGLHEGIRFCLWDIMTVFGPWNTPGLYGGSLVLKVQFVHRESEEMGGYVMVVSFSRGWNMQHRLFKEKDLSRFWPQDVTSGCILYLPPPPPPPPSWLWVQASPRVLTGCPGHILQIFNCVLSRCPAGKECKLLWCICGLGVMISASVCCPALRSRKMMEELN